MPYHASCAEKAKSSAPDVPGPSSADRGGKRKFMWSMSHGGSWTRRGPALLDEHRFWLPLGVGVSPSGLEGVPSA